MLLNGLVDSGYFNSIHMNTKEESGFGHIKDGFFPHYPIYDYNPKVDKEKLVSEDVNLDREESIFDLKATRKEFRNLKSAFFSEVEIHVTKALDSYKRRFSFVADPEDYIYSMATNPDVLVKLWEMALQYSLKDEAFNPVNRGKADDTMTQLELEL